MCKRNPSTIVDHKIPHKGVWALFLELSNLGGACKRCHDIKTSREDGGYGRAPATHERTETPKPVPTGEKGGAEFQSSSISTTKLDKALEMADDFLDGI
jgi:5-methylcytosine-specific restriction protein A